MTFCKLKAQKMQPWGCILSIDIQCLKMDLSLKLDLSLKMDLSLKLGQRRTLI